jgi:hypothetical protein
VPCPRGVLYSIERGPSRRPFVGTLKFQAMRKSTSPTISSLAATSFCIFFIFSFWMCGGRRTIRVRQSAPLVTFVIPCKGRSTLNRALESIRNQTNPLWNVVVILDGVDTRPYDDHRIHYRLIPKTAHHNFAAQLRNFGIQFARSEWVAFLDDDDAILPSYIDRLQDEIQRDRLVECVIFRMHRTPSPSILPKPNSRNFFVNEVGISFAVRKNLFIQGFFFVPGPTEDFVFLDRVRGAGRKVVISEYLTYLVRAAPSEKLTDQCNCSRAVLN